MVKLRFQLVGLDDTEYSGWALWPVRTNPIKRFRWEWKGRKDGIRNAQIPQCLWVGGKSDFLTQITLLGGLHQYRGGYGCVLNQQFSGCKSLLDQCFQAAHDHR